MIEDSAHTVTGLLQAWRAGDSAALDQLTRLVYGELHRMAHIHLARAGRGQTLDTREVVNETYLRLANASRVDWTDRAHFFAISARIMRQVLIQHARVRCAQKRGGGRVMLELSERLVASPQRSRDLIALDDALSTLDKIDAREAEIVELRFFGGLSEQETAHVLGISDRTVRREWEHAKVWLIHELRRGAHGREPAV